MNQTIVTLVAGFSLACANAIAADDHKGHAGHGSTAKPAASAQAGTAMSDGEVRKIEKERGRITLKHGEIKNLDMPPMTMVFRVQDPALLDRVKEGDRIGFTAEKIGGQYTVTGIEARK